MSNTGSRWLRPAVLLVLIGVLLVGVAFGATSQIGLGRSASEICENAYPGAVDVESSRPLLPMVVVRCAAQDFDTRVETHEFDPLSTLVLAAGIASIVVGVSAIRRQKLNESSQKGQR